MYIGLLRPFNVTQVIVEATKVMGIGLKRPSTTPQIIAEFMNVGQVWTATIYIAIVEDMLIEVDLGHKIPANILLAIKKQELMLKGEVDICLRPAIIFLINRVNVVYC